MTFSSDAQRHAAFAHMHGVVERPPSRFTRVRRKLDQHVSRVITDPHWRQAAEDVGVLGALYGASKLLPSVEVRAFKAWHRQLGKARKGATSGGRFWLSKAIKEVEKRRGRHGPKYTPDLVSQAKKNARVNAAISRTMAHGTPFTDWNAPGAPTKYTGAWEKRVGGKITHYLNPFGPLRGDPLWVKANIPVKVVPPSLMHRALEGSKAALKSPRFWKRAGIGAGVGAAVVGAHALYRRRKRRRGQASV